MKRYFEVRPKFKSSSSGSVIEDPPESQYSRDMQLAVPSNFANEREKNVELETLISDLGRRKPISEYHRDIRNENLSNYGGDHFVGLGFDDSNNPSRIGSHANSTNSSHGDCVHMGHDLMNPNQSIGTSLECNQDIVKVLNCAPRNNYMTSPVIQKDLAAVCAFEKSKKIVNDIGDDVFGVLIDESGDCSGKVQMAVVVCGGFRTHNISVVKAWFYHCAKLLERFPGIIHVKETSANSLKETLQNLLSLHKLSLSSIRGQGYDGASNMRGRYGGLKTLIQNENPSPYYVHCFAHQLQLTLVACAKSHIGVSGFFGMINMLVNLIRSSNKRMELLRGKQKVHYANLIEEGLIVTGSGLNQESSIVRAGDTRWGSHFRTLTSMMILYTPVLGVLEKVGDDSSFDMHGEAVFLLDLLQSFDFIFLLYLMVEVLEISHDLTVALQRCDQDLLNALKLVNIAKQRLQEMRDDGWEKHFFKVVAICNKHEFDVPDMDALYVQGKKSRRRTSSTSNMHHYKNDCLFSVLDLQLQELNARFDVENTELLYCVACFSPSSSFAAFDEDKLFRMVELYPTDFVEFPEVIVRNQLQNYIEDVRCDPNFSELKGLSDLCRKLVETNKCTTYNVVYKLVKLALILPVATTSVERVFSAMKYVKSELCSKMGDQWLNDRLVTFIERDVLKTISNDIILAHFQEMDGKCMQFSL
ncbi:hypothetical protein OROGR_025118 [Orobanche gracilis]